jgi:hypothetical protein
MYLPRLFQCIVVIGSLLPATASAQAKLPAKEIDRLVSAHQGDFDYLLGDWSFISESKEWGKGRGVWSVLRLEDGQIFDEYRVVGDTGQTWYMTQTVRAYNVLTDRWDLVSLERGTGLTSLGSGQRVGNEMHITQTFTNLNGPTGILRIRYYDISPDHFRWVADRSTDGGKSWQLKNLTIEATRTGPPRELARLTKAAP